MLLVVGKAVTYFDEYSRPHYALVTADWGNQVVLGTSAINLVYVTTDDAKTDPYGAQIERASSVSPKRADVPEATAHGRYYVHGPGPYGEAV